MSTVNIASLCRVCVNPSYYHANVFNKLTLDGDRLFEAINTICQLDLIEGDGLPEYICKECDFKLSEIEVFKQSCRKGRRKLLALKNEEIGECIANEGGTLGCCGSDEIDIEEHHPDIKTERLDEENERACSEEYDDNDNKYSSTNKADIEPPNNAVAQANVKLEENVSMFDCQKEEESLVDVSLIQQHEVFIKVEPFVYEQCIDESTPYQETGDSIQNYTQESKRRKADRRLKDEEDAPIRGLFREDVHQRAFINPLRLVSSNRSSLSFDPSVSRPHECYTDPTNSSRPSSDLPSFEVSSPPHVPGNTQPNSSKRRRPVAEDLLEELTNQGRTRLQLMQRFVTGRAKTGAERQKAYKARLKASKPKKIVKSAAERQREYRERAKMKKLFASAKIIEPSTSQDQPATSWYLLN